MEVADRVVVVTGGARGIGRALARRFAHAGAEAVVVADIDADGAWTVAREIGGMAIRCDVSREEEVADLVKKTLTAKGRIDIFCSNAGIAVGGGPEATNADWQRIWDVNLMSHVFVARHVLPGMLDRKEEQVADVVIEGIKNEKFLILPHPEVAVYFNRKAQDYDRWLKGMRRLRTNLLAASN